MRTPEMRNDRQYEQFDTSPETFQQEYNCDLQFANKDRQI